MSEKVIVKKLPYMENTTKVNQSMGKILNIVNNQTIYAIVAHGFYWCEYLEFSTDKEEIVNIYNNKYSQKREFIDEKGHNVSCDTIEIIEFDLINYLQECYKKMNKKIDNQHDTIQNYSKQVTEMRNNINELTAEYKKNILKNLISELQKEVDKF